MKKVLMMGAGVLLACLAIGPASASAAGSASGTLIACLGAGTDTGSFQTQTIGTGTIAGLGLSEPLCVFAKPSALGTTVNTLLGGLSAIKPPSQLPSQADLTNLLTSLQNVQPGVFAVLEMEALTCQALHASDTCNAITGSALSAALGNFPLGTVTLQGNGEPCFLGSQTGTGSAFGPDFFELDWKADYNGTAGLLGQISGNAHSVFEGKDYQLGGLVGPQCGSGVKAMVLTVS